MGLGEFRSVAAIRKAPSAAYSYSTGGLSAVHLQQRGPPGIEVLTPSGGFRGERSERRGQLRENVGRLLGSSTLLGFGSGLGPLTRQSSATRGTSTRRPMRNRGDLASADSLVGERSADAKQCRRLLGGESEATRAGRRGCSGRSTLTARTVDGGRCPRRGRGEGLGKRGRSPDQNRGSVTVASGRGSGRIGDHRAGRGLTQETGDVLRAECLSLAIDDGDLGGLRHVGGREGMATASWASTLASPRAAGRPRHVGEDRGGAGRMYIR